MQTTTRMAVCYRIEVTSINSTSFMWWWICTDLLSSRFAAPRFFSHSQHLLGLPTDPTLRRLALDRNAERKRLRYANDPEFREREKARCLKRQRKKDDETRKQDVTRWVARIRQKRIEDPLTRLYSVIDRWVRSVIDKPVQWSTHRPVVHAEKVGLRCEDCTRESFRKAALWVCKALLLVLAYETHLAYLVFSPR